MLRTTKGLICGIAICLSLPGVATATVITDLYGDKDGLGIGVADGGAFNYRSVTATANDAGTITDRWMYGDKSWSHTYDLTGLGPVVEGSLEIFTGGQGFRGLSKLFVDGTLVGTLTDGDGYDRGGDRANRGRLDAFDLAPWLTLLDGAETLRVELALSGDGWAFDYSELTIKTDDSPVSVSEPATLTLALLGVGLAGFGASVRRRA